MRNYKLSVRGAEVERWCWCDKLQTVKYTNEEVVDWFSIGSVFVKRECGFGGDPGVEADKYPETNQYPETNKYPETNQYSETDEYAQADKYTAADKYSQKHTDSNPAGEYWSKSSGQRFEL